MKHNLKDLRLANRLSQKELAEKVGVGPTMPGMREAGLRSVNPTRVQAMAELFRVPLESIAHWSDSVPRKRTAAERGLPGPVRDGYRWLTSLEEVANSSVYKRSLKNRARTLAGLLAEDLAQKEEKFRSKKKGSKV